MFGLFLSGITTGDGDVEFTVGSFKKTPENLHRKGKNPISLFFRFFWRKMIRFFSYSEKEIAKEALVYPEDEINLSDEK